MMLVAQSVESLVKCTAKLIAVPVDCEGLGAKGTGATRLMQRYPEALEGYAAACERGEVAPGAVLLYEVGGEGARPRWLALVAVKERRRDQTLVEHVDVGLRGLRDVVARERVSSVALAPLGFEPDVMSWDDAWRALRGRIRAVFRGMGELVITVHAPSASRRWPNGCPSVSQLRAGRVLSGLGVRELAVAAAASPTAVSMIETRKSAVPRKMTLLALRRALEARGVEFGPGGWVRLADDRGLVVDDAASMSRSACVRALEAVEKAGRILRGACGGAGEDGAGEAG